MMSMGQTWSQEEHAHFPPAFKNEYGRAVRQT